MAGAKKILPGWPQLFLTEALSEGDVEMIKKRIKLYEEMWSMGWIQKDFAKKSGLCASKISLIMCGRLIPTEREI